MAQKEARRTTAGAPAEASTRAPAARVSGSREGDAVHRIIDEIDEVLEENAAEFVKGYVQRGGE